MSFMRQKRIAQQVAGKIAQQVQEVPLHQHPVQLQPPKRQRKKFPLQGFIDFQGLKIDVETAAGQVRKGTNPDGKAWETHMKYSYGEIRGTEGTDGDKLDCYVGPNHDSSLVVVVHQQVPATKAFDEDKVMLGFDTADAAVEAYKAHYDRPDYYQSHLEMSIGQFWRWVGDVKNRGRKVTGANGAWQWWKVQQALSISGLYGRPVVRAGSSKTAGIYSYRWSAVEREMKRLDEDCREIRKVVRDYVRKEEIKTDSGETELSELRRGAIGDSLARELKGVFPVSRFCDNFSCWSLFIHGHVMHSVDGAESKVQHAVQDVRDVNLTMQQWENYVCGCLDELESVINNALRQAGPASFTYQGFKIDNSERLPDTTVQQLLDGVDFVLATFRKRGVEGVLQKSVREFVFDPLSDLYPNASGMYEPLSGKITVFARNVGSHLSKSSLLTKWVHHTFLHEIGHHVEEALLHPAAKAAWRAPWDAAKADKGDLPLFLQNAGLPTDYAATDEGEDFAESFVAFMAAPQKLSKNAMFRMQQALSISGLYGRPVVRASAEAVIRPVGWEASSDEARVFMNRLGHGLLWRGMTEKEYRATVGQHKPVWSTGAYSTSGEGTCFTKDPEGAESYVNFGRDDPRKTGAPTYLVGVRPSAAIIRASDGYYKTQTPVPYHDVVVVIEMYAKDEAVVGRKIKGNTEIYPGIHTDSPEKVKAVALQWVADVKKQWIVVRKHYDRVDPENSAQVATYIKAQNAFFEAVVRSLQFDWGILWDRADRAVRNIIKSFDTRSVSQLSWQDIEGTQDRLYKGLAVFLRLVVNPEKKHAPAEERFSVAGFNVVNHITEPAYAHRVSPNLGYMADPAQVNQIVAEALKKTKELLSRKGLGGLCYGSVDLTLADGTSLATYEREDDTISVHYNQRRFNELDLVRTLIHELGHRFMFRVMTEAERMRWAVWKTEFKVPAVSEYGGTGNREKFAEVFMAYVYKPNLLTREAFEEFQAIVEPHHKAITGSERSGSHEQVAERAKVWVAGVKKQWKDLHAKLKQAARTSDLERRSTQIIALKSVVDKFLAGVMRSFQYDWNVLWNRSDDQVRSLIVLTESARAVVYSPLEFETYLDYLAHPDRNTDPKRFGSMAYHVQMNGAADADDCVKRFATPRMLSSLVAAEGHLFKALDAFLHMIAASPQLRHAPAETTFSVAGFRVNTVGVMEPVSTYPVPYAAEGGYLTDPAEVNRSVAEALKDARGFLSRKGLSDLCYGYVEVIAHSHAPQNMYGAQWSVAAAYDLDKDMMQIFTTPVGNDRLAGMLVHELGHRYYFKKMSKADRQKWELWLSKFKVPAVTKYGGAHATEKFAEVFMAYVCKPNLLTRDAFEEFRAIMEPRVRVHAGSIFDDNGESK